MSKRTDRRKRNRRGTKRMQKDQSLLILGKPQKNRPVFITEGYATGASIHEATGGCTVTAFKG